MLDGTRDQIVDAYPSLVGWRHCVRITHRIQFAKIVSGGWCDESWYAFVDDDKVKWFIRGVVGRKMGFMTISQKSAIKVLISYGTYVMENVLFKNFLSAEFHAQTAVECVRFAYLCCHEIRSNWAYCVEDTKRSAVRIVVNQFPEIADRDHCLRYSSNWFIVWWLDADHYEDGITADRIDTLKYCKSMWRRYLSLRRIIWIGKRSIANWFIVQNGSSTENWRLVSG